VWQEPVKNAKGLPTGELVHGLYTSNSGKPGAGKRDQYFNELMNMVNARPDLLHSDNLIDELRNLEQKQNGRIEAMRGQHDDSVMSYCFCLYVRKLMIQNGDIFIEGEISAFSLSPNTIMDFISVTIGEGGSNVEDESWIEQDINDEGFIFQTNKKKKETDNFRMEDYLIGM